MTRMQIRIATAADAKRLAELLLELGYARVEGDVAAFLARPHGMVVFVAEDAFGGIVGMGEVALVDGIASGPHVELHSLVVDGRIRGGGTGGALLAWAEEWARAAGAPFLRVRSNVTRARAHKFYTERGYTEKKRQAVFEKRLAGK